MEPVDRFVSVNGLRFHYVDWPNDQGPALVALHGISSQARMWDGLAAAIGDRWRLVAPDLRGHGQSEWAADYSPLRMAEDVAQLVTHLGPSKFNLIGHSMGGRVAMLYAGMHPDAIERLVISDIGPDRSGAPPALPRRREFATIDEARDEVKRLRGTAPTTDALRHNLRQREDGRWVWRYDPELLTKRSPVDRDRFWSALRNMPAPVLVLRGANSTVLSRSSAETMVAAIPHGSLVEIAGTGHGLWMERPREFAEAVRLFLTDVTS